MVGARRVDAFVHRLEDRISASIAGHDRIVLAHSGGLASTLVAMVARKRCDLQCFVAGVEGAQDVEAAKVAKDYLDYRMHFVMLDAESARTHAIQVSEEFPGLTPAERKALIPLHAVLAQTRAECVLAGFGSPHLRPAIAAALRRADIRLPLHGIVRGLLPRAHLRDAALGLGLPAPLARVAHRAPAAGAGIEDFLHRSAIDLQ